MSPFLKKQQEGLSSETELSQLENVPETVPVKDPETTSKEHENIAEAEEGQKGEREEARASQSSPSAQPQSITDVQTEELQTDEQQRQIQIERILEQDLADAYFSMDPPHQKMFKEAGEKTSKQINEVLAHAKINIAKIFELIKSWLRMVPGINKWYVVQEAKIKTEKIVKLKKTDEV